MSSNLRGKGPLSYLLIYYTYQSCFLVLDLFCRASIFHGPAMLLPLPEPSACTLPRNLHCCIIDGCLEVKTGFPDPLSFQNYTVKNSQLKVTRVLNAISVSISQGVGRDSVFIGEQEYIGNQSHSIDSVSDGGADRRGSWGRRVTLC